MGVGWRTLSIGDWAQYAAVNRDFGSLLLLAPISSPGGLLLVLGVISCNRSSVLGVSANVPPLLLYPDGVATCGND